MLAASNMRPRASRSSPRSTARGRYETTSSRQPSATALEPVGERVEAGRRGEVRGQPDGELGIEHRHARHQRRVEDDRLDPGVAGDDDRRAADLAAGPRGGRDGVDRRHRVDDQLVAALAVVVARQRRLVRGAHRDRLGDVHRAAAAQRDDAVERGARPQRDPLLDVLLDRVAVHLGVAHHHQPGAGEPALDLVGQPGAHHAGVGDQEEALAALVGQPPGQVAHRARAVQDRGRIVEDVHQTISR
jgi:hypothetical protein